MIGRNNTVLLLMFAAIDGQPQAGPSGDCISQNLREEPPVSRSATLRVCSKDNERHSHCHSLSRNFCFDQVPQSQLVTSRAAWNSTSSDQNVLTSHSSIRIQTIFYLAVVAAKRDLCGCTTLRSCMPRSRTSEATFLTVFLPKY